MPRERPVLDQLNLVVGSMPASLEFYRRLGVDIPDRDPGWDRHHRSGKTESGAQVELDSTAFTPHWNRGWPKDKTGIVIGFRVASRERVDELYTELTAAGHRGMQPPYDAPWGARYAVVEDPDGNAVGLMSKSDPKRRGSYPDPGTLG